MTFLQFVEGNNGIVHFVDAYIIPLLYAIAFLVFLIGIVRFFFIEGEDGRKKGRDFIVWGLFGFFVLFSVWGLVQVLLSVLQGTNG